MIEIWTDGCCLGNPGPGGYAAIIVDGDSRFEISGSDPDTTNNRMELTAVIKGFQAVDPNQPVTIYSDSTYALLGARVVGRGRPRKANKDLWRELIAVAGRRTAGIIWTKVKAHSGIASNELADSLANKAAKSMKDHYSDCAVHNGPALATGNCNCPVSELAENASHRAVIVTVARPGRCGCLACNAEPPRLIEAQKLPA